MKPDIKQLVDKFWAGTSTLEEEQELKYILEDYGFEEEYPELYAYFGLIENETAKKLSSAFKDQLKSIPNTTQVKSTDKQPELSVQPTQKKQFKYWFAASILLTAGIFTLQKKDRQAKEIEAQIAFNQAKYSLGIISNKMNKSTSYIKQVEKFAQTQNKVKNTLKK